MLQNFKKKHHHLSYRTILLVSTLSALIIAILFVAGYMYAYSSKLLVDRTVLYQQKALEANANSLAAFFRSIDLTAASISENDELLQSLSQQENDRYSTLDANQRISTLLSSFVYSNPQILHINIITDRFNNCSSWETNGLISEDRISENLLNRTSKLSDSGWVILEERDGLESALSGGDTIVSYYQNIYYKSTGRRVGTLLISCSESTFYSMIQSFLPDSETEVSLLSPSGLALSPSGEEPLSAENPNIPAGSVLLDQDNQILLLSQTVPQYGWTIIQRLNLRQLTQDLDLSMRYTVILCGAVLLLMAVVSLFLSRSISLPLRQFTQMLESLSRTGFQPNQNHFIMEEVDRLNTQFNVMIGEIHQLMERVSREQKEKHITELKLLQAEINPHFIYNTIELINFVAAKNGQSTICEIVHALGRFLRLSLNNGKLHLTIAQEIEHVSQYIRLQQFKYEDSFCVEWDIAPGILGNYTIKLILQPLVENCLVHGFAESGGEGCIWIQGYMENGDIVFTVRDDGCGMDSQTAVAILTRQTAGYGVYNVHQRIQAAFGPHYGLRYETGLGEGTSVFVRLPVLFEPPKETEH